MPFTMVLPTEETAAPAEDVEASKRQPGSASDENNNENSAGLSEDEKKEEAEVAGEDTKSAAPAQEVKASDDSVEVRVDATEDKKDSEVPAEESVAATKDVKVEASADENKVGQSITEIQGHDKEAPSIEEKGSEGNAARKEPPTPVDNTQGDIEEGFPITDADADKSPETPSREKDLSVEHGVPPETPARDAKKDTDPESPSCETAVDESFDSADAVDGSVEISKKSKRRRNHFLFATIILVLIVGVVLGIVFGTGLVGKSNESSVQGASGPNAPPTDGKSNESSVQGASGPNAPPADGSAPAPSPTVGEDTPEDPGVLDDPLLGILKGFSTSGLDDVNSPQFKAYEWMRNEDPLSDANTEPAKLQQRYSLATMYASLVGEIPSYATNDECSWPTVECGTLNATNLFGTEQWQVTEINMARMSLNGNIPAEIGLLAPSLVSVDMAENPDLTGSLPEELYTLTNLKYVYLHDNALSGSLSESISNLQLLDSLYLGNNKLTGTIPYNLGSREATRRPMRFLILQNNQLTGPIPNEMSLSHMFYMDLSFNQLTGTLPADIGETFSRLKQLYLDHNKFTGTIPSTYAQAGGGRIYVLTLDNNQLTGGVPTGWQKDNLFLDTITVQGNQLTEPIDKEICKFSALENGELVQVGAECSICTCDVLCDDCY